MKKKDRVEVKSPIELDDLRAKENEEAGRTICEKCGGTGNQFYSMYKECSDCGGKGYLK